MATCLHADAVAGTTVNGAAIHKVMVIYWDKSVNHLGVCDPPWVSHTGGSTVSSARAT